MTNKNPSLKVNMLLNLLNGILGVAFPLISFPYVSRILGVDNIGKYNFITTFISYFSLIAMLGIQTYAIREGAKIRDNVKKIETFSSEIFSISVISTVISYVLLGLSLLFIGAIKPYAMAIIIVSIPIAFTTMAVEWLFCIYEKYIFLTVRNIISKIISLVLLFVLVKQQDDLYLYCVATVAGYIFIGIIDFLYSRKICKIVLTKAVDYHRHLKPILLLFALSISVVIFSNSDTTILGLLCDDHTLGIYAVSTKVYTVLKGGLGACVAVCIPRLSSYLGLSKIQLFKETSLEIYKILITFTVPLVVGIIILSHEIVLLLSTSDFIEAQTSLIILAISIFFCVCSYFWGQCILIPYNQERIVFISTIIGAVINILLNIILIPFYKEVAAAITTLLAEIICFSVARIYGKKYINPIGTFTIFLKSLLGACLFMPLSYIVHQQGFSYGLNISIIIPLCVIIYLAFELSIKNEAIIALLEQAKNVLRRL